jgi:hypothetical protein
MMEAARTSETSVDNYFTRQYIPEDNSEQLHQFTVHSNHAHFVSSYYSHTLKPIISLRISGI